MRQPDQGKPKRLAGLNSTWLFPLLAAGLTIFALWGTQFVPFHPDESTYLFMSSDFETLFTSPMSMAWSREKEGDLRQHYRKIDAPLTRYILGAGRSVAKLPPLPVDWDWSKAWEENRGAGALPSQPLLIAGRVTITLLLPFSLLFTYLVGKRLSGTYTGLFATALLGINTLILLHNRRAMAEGALTLSLLFAMWCFLQGDKHPWLAGLGSALAFNAKHSALVMFPIGLFAVCWIPADIPNRPKKILIACGQYLGAFALITLALNPLYWKHPIDAIQSAWNSRQDLLRRQVEDTAELAPEQNLTTPGKRLAVLTANLYIMEPSFAEVGNYKAQTAALESSYLAIPGHNLMRNFYAGGLMLLLSMFGMAIAIWRLRSSSHDMRRAIVLVLFGTLAQILAVVLFIPLNWQRYVIPVVPFVCIWTAYAICHRCELRDSQDH